MGTLLIIAREEVRVGTYVVCKGGGGGRGGFFFCSGIYTLTLGFWKVIYGA